MKGERDWRDMRGWGTDREYPDPGSVREALTGGGGSDGPAWDVDSLADLPSTESGSFRNLGDRTPGEVAQEARRLFEEGLSSDGERVNLTVVTSDFEEEAKILGEVAALAERCPTCGRMFDCICPNCSTCGDGGRPKKLEVR